MSITIECDKYYRAEDGSKQGPMVGRTFKWVDGNGASYHPAWSNDGLVDDRYPDPHGPLIAEWVDEPKWGDWSITEDAAYVQGLSDQSQARQLSEGVWAVRVRKELVREIKTLPVQAHLVRNFMPKFSEGRVGEEWVCGDATTETVDGELVKITWVAS